jgi:hypothetical protein
MVDFKFNNQMVWKIRRTSSRGLTRAIFRKTSALRSSIRLHKLMAFSFGLATVGQLAPPLWIHTLYLQPLYAVSSVVAKHKWSHIECPFSGLGKQQCSELDTD